MKKITFLIVNWVFLAHIRAPLIVLITFRLISVLSWSFEEIQKLIQNDGSKMAVMTPLPRDMTTSLPVVDVKENVF